MQKPNRLSSHLGLPPLEAEDATVYTHKGCYSLLSSPHGTQALHPLQQRLSFHPSFQIRILPPRSKQQLLPAPSSRSPMPTFPTAANSTWAGGIIVQDPRERGAQAGNRSRKKLDAVSDNGQK
ncbi:hypothetical protein M758_6G176700 [Ceratodon purpureus]|nr:hypothetical protein M758_6G176700 [Ceratodon purpureus]